VAVLRLEPDEVKLVAELERLARKANIWDEFVREYGSLVDEIADPADSTRHILEIGRIYASESGREDEAIASFERVLSHDPGSPEALARLEGLYRQKERWADLARILRERETRATDLPERRRLRSERTALLLGPLSDEAQAAAVLEAAVAEEPDDRAALRSLEVLYREQRREPERLGALERLLPIVETDEERVNLLRKMASIHRARPDGADAATTALEKAFALGDRRDDTLESLVRTYEQRASWASCAEVLDRWAEATTARPTRAELRARAGKIYWERLADPIAAEERYADALELDAESPTVLSAMAALSRDRGDHLRAAKFLLESAERTRSPLERGRLFYEAAVLHHDRLDGEARAVELYARALDADPEQVGAASRLAPIYEKAQAWAALEPLLDLLAHRDDIPDAQVADYWRQLAECARKLGKPDKAARSYESARALAPDSVAVLRGLADLNMERQLWVEARALYDEVRQRFEEILAVPDKVDLYTRLARCSAQMEDPEAALRWFGTAVALDPPVDEKVALLEETAELLAGKLARAADAISTLQQVLEVAPTRRQALHRLLELHTEHKQWPLAVAALDRLAGLEPTAAVRAKYHYAAALIERDELAAPEAALLLLNRALDDDPEMERALEASEQLLTDAEDWKELSRHYRRSLKRLPQQGGLADLRARLWNALGLVSLRNLGDRQAAIAALEVASSLDPENLARRELLADLYIEVGPSAAEKAVAQHQFLVARRPDRVESYQALAALFQQMQSYDKLWCAAGALTYLGRADHYLHSFWERHRLADVPVAVGKLVPELWRSVIHPREDTFISALFALLAPALALTTAERHQARGVRRGDRVDLSRGDWFPAVALRYVSTTLEMPLPDLFVREKDPQTVSIYNLRDKTGLTPALVMGQGFGQWSTPWEVVFDLAKRMAFLRWERFPRFALSTEVALDIAVRAGLALGGQPLDAAGHNLYNGEVEKTRSQLAQMVPPPLAEQIASLARRFRGERGDVIDIAEWIVASDLTAARVAFVLSSDLPAAVRVLSAEPAAISPLPLEERINDVLAFSVSEEYFKVRKALGLHVV
jgi:tetratricopeptide (TPR) repeat protein